MIEAFKIIISNIDESQTLAEFKGRQFTSDSSDLITFSFDGIQRRVIPLIKSTLYKIKIIETISNLEIYNNLAVYKGYDYAVSSAPFLDPEGNEIKDIRGNIKYETATYANHINFLEV